MTLMVLETVQHLIPRWHGHGDLRLLVDHPYVYLDVDDLHALTGAPLWGTGEVLVEPELFLEHGGRYYLRLADAIERVELHGTPTASDFLTWLDEQLPHLLTPDVLADATRVAGFAQSHTVRRAAAILDTDPAISIGRQSLFEHMEHLGWVERNSPSHDDWVITHLAHTHGWLTQRAVRVPTGGREHRRYLQTYVTPDGLAQLRRTLHGVSTDPPPAPALSSLFD